MPALPAVPSVVRTALKGTIYGAPFLTRFYTQYTGTAPSAAQLATFNASIATAYTTNLRSLIDVATTLVEIDSADLTSSTGAVAISPQSIVGTRAGAELPNQISGVVSYSVARRYRGGHPRGYWRVGITGDLSTGLLWAASFVTACNTGFAAFFTAVLGAGWSGAGTLTHVNVSYYRGFTVVINPITGRARNVPTLRAAPTVDTVTSAVLRSSIGTQRRREQFVD